MSSVNPNRVSAGKSGAGRYDFKHNTEAEIDLVDEDLNTSTRKQHYVELETRAREADLSSRTEMRKNPTLDTFRMQFEKHHDTIVEVLKHGSKSYGDDLVVPVKDFHHMIDLRLKSENPVPKELGGVRIEVLFKGEVQTIVIYEEPAEGKKIDTKRLVDLADKRLSKLSHSKTDATAFMRAFKQAEDGDAGCWAEFELGKNDKARLSYVEVVYLPSRRSDFIENHGGSAPVADGWL